MILHNPTLWIIKSIIFLYYFDFFIKRDLIFTLRNCIFLYFHFPFNWADLFYYIALDATTVSWEGRPNQVLMANISFYLAGKMNSTLAPPRSFFSLDYRHYSAPQCNFKIIYSVIVVKMNIVIWKYYMYYLWGVRKMNQQFDGEFNNEERCDKACQSIEAVPVKPSNAPSNCIVNVRARRLRDRIWNGYS